MTGNELLEDLKNMTPEELKKPLRISLFTAFGPFTYDVTSLDNDYKHATFVNIEVRNVD